MEVEGHEHACFGFKARGRESFAYTPTKKGLLYAYSFVNLILLRACLCKLYVSSAAMPFG